MENNTDKLKALRNDYKKTFETEEGKRVFKDLEMTCLYNDQTFDKDSLVMAFNEGTRAVYLRMKKIINMDIEELERIANATNQGGK